MIIEPKATGNSGEFPLSFVPLDLEKRTLLPTDAAAFHLNRRPQTLRCWSHYGAGLLTPIKIGSRLAWKTADIRRLLGLQ